MKRNTILFTIALVAAIAFVGSAQALIQPLGGQINTSGALANTATGQYITVYLDVNPSDYQTVQMTDNPAPYHDSYQFQDIEPMLLRNGFISQQTYNATVVMHCGGTQRDQVGTMGDSYVNTHRNTTPTTAHVMGKYDGNQDTPSILDVELCAVEETFSKTLYAGWNLISLPLTPDDDSEGAVLSGVSHDAVYRYNATSKQFESADAMNPGTGYFVHATAESAWEYSGTPYTSVDVSLKQGLNMVGWLNCSKDVDVLYSISWDYYYAAKWNATAEKFDVYNPVAPSTFNDFTAMDRGTGYFISAKQECTLSESC